ncbi:MAG: phosphoenolpyruvate--protein phosphotransferase [Oscillospiraceae bacterium]|nr:phosphoenolpyruvate--protein phosphotransferase [Oscillospiraceae bacterium]
MRTIKAKSVYQGIAIGRAFYYRRAAVEIPDTPSADADAEWTRLEAALEAADQRLESTYHRVRESIGSAEAQIFDTHRLILSDEDLLDTLRAKITEGKNALQSVFEGGAEFSAFFEALDDDYMRARAIDIRDVSVLVLKILSNIPEQEMLLSPAIVVADDLTPGETIQMDKKNILAFVTRGGSASSHTAILARTMGIPSLVQADITEADLEPDMLMAVDGFSGICYLAPDRETLACLEEKRQKEAAHRREIEAVRGLSSTSLCGRTMQVFANISGNEDLPLVLEHDAEGIGLLRSEFLYLGRNTPPSEETQFVAYRNIAEKMGGRKVIIRTMDIGADKQVDYLGLASEENPALGYRAIRIMLDRPDLFSTQLRAICRASAYGNVAIMFPMISSLWELRACKAALEDARESVTRQGLALSNMEVGIMIETPASVIIRDALAKEVDFFSVGTNDLTQYTLAVDRQNQNLERYADPHHPAIFEMLRLIAQSASAHGIWAGICGELAGDLSLTERFLEMGYSELSVAPPLVLPLRKAIRDSRVVC